MSANEPNIEQIRKYLNGELDARAMFELERQAAQDPFLWDVMRGMESSDQNNETNLNAIDELIKKRVEQDKKRVVSLWRYLPIAASLLIALGIGGWWVFHEPVQAPIVLNTPKITMPDKAKVEKVQADTQQILFIGKKPLLAKLSKEKLYAPDQAYSNYESAASAAMAKQFKTDTTEYKASAYAVRLNTTTNDLLKKMPGLEVDSTGNVTAQGKMLKSVRVNGKNFYGGDIKIATKNLPADVLQSIQAVDNYGDQASKKVNGGDAGVAERNALYFKSVQVKAKEENEARIVTGKVVDINRSPLPGVSIRIEGTNIATQTGLDGTFKINVPGENATLYVAYIGYEGKQVKVKDKDNVTIALKESSNSLSEVVVTGYGTEKKDVVIEDAHPIIGWKAYNKYLEDKAISTNGKTGVVKLSFTIENNGTISNIRVLKGLNEELNSIAVNLVQSGPKWLAQSGEKAQEVKIRIKFHK